MEEANEGPKHFVKKNCDMFEDEDATKKLTTILKDTHISLVNAGPEMTEIQHVIDGVTKTGYVPSRVVGKVSAATYHLDTTSSSFDVKPIGIFESVFPDKNGTPRQGAVVPHGKGRLKLTIPQGHYALDGLTGFTHCWLVFIFHRNSPYSDDQVKVRPPRLNGKVIGMYATRTPHRPNNIGLTCAKIESVEGETVHLSALDLIDGTPIIDIKPYVPYSDCIQTAKCPEWITGDESISRDQITFSERANEDIVRFTPHCKYYKDPEEVKEAIIEVLMTDPRPIYMKKKQSNKLYGFRFDVLNVRCANQGVDAIKVIQVELWEQ
ncbi:tRNA methylase [Acrasis kona]|uniref:tRNA methylase n=1 Tax=Acrasis kona TaxID=1008807 RepID=A0AAW2ZIG3_9EUKA